MHYRRQTRCAPRSSEGRAVAITDACHRFALSARKCSSSIAGGLTPSVGAELKCNCTTVSARTAVSIYDSFSSNGDGFEEVPALPFDSAWLAAVPSRRNCTVQFVISDPGAGVEWKVDTRLTGPDLQTDYASTESSFVTVTSQPLSDHPSTLSAFVSSDGFVSQMTALPVHSVSSSHSISDPTIVPEWIVHVT